MNRDWITMVGVDHESGLWVKKENDKYWWTVDFLDEETNSWEQISEELYNELIKHKNKQICQTEV